MKKPRIKRSRQEIEKLVNENIGLVKYIIINTIQKRIIQTMYDDLYSEGLLGLFRAAEIYDPRISKFSTYAGLRIRARINRYVRTRSTIISIPDHFSQESLKKYDRKNKEWKSISAVMDARQCLPLENFLVENNECQSLDKIIQNPKDLQHFVLLLRVFLGKNRATLLMRKYGIDRKLMNYSQLSKMYGITKQAIWYRIHNSIVKLRNASPVFSFYFRD